MLLLSRSLCCGPGASIGYRDVVLGTPDARLELNSGTMMSLRYGKSTGCLETITPDGTIRRSTFKCQHCQFIVSFEAIWIRRCRRSLQLCDDLICANCVRRGVCITVEECCSIWKALDRPRQACGMGADAGLIAIGT